MNYNNKYTGISDEFVGIKRLNVFKFFEDTNMLLPIETFHDVENNRVYTHVDELGTYCLMDMEIWLEGLGITAEDLGESTVEAAAPAAYSIILLSDEEEEQKYLDVVLIAYPVDRVFEAVYDMSGKLLTYENDPHSCSTYNYCGPSDKFSHAMLDVIPYYLYYSVPEIENPYQKVLINLGIDLTVAVTIDKMYILNIADEVCELASVENRIKYYSNPTAQNYRQNQVLSELYTDCIFDKKECIYGKGDRPNETDDI